MIKRYDIRPRRKKSSSSVTPAGPAEANASDAGDELEPVGSDVE